jgi:hypothetical protein
MYIGVRCCEADQLGSKPIFAELETANLPQARKRAVKISRCTDEDIEIMQSGKKTLITKLIKKRFNSKYEPFLYLLQWSLRLSPFLFPQKSENQIPRMAVLGGQPPGPEPGDGRF